FQIGNPATRRNSDRHFPSRKSDLKPFQPGSECNSPRIRRKRPQFPLRPRHKNRFLFSIMSDAFSTVRKFTTGYGKEGSYFSLPALEEAGVGPISRLPV